MVAAILPFGNHPIEYMFGNLHDTEQLSFEITYLMPVLADFCYIALACLHKSLITTS